ncbi:MAG: hypothetical protein KBF59_03775 [Ignavibacterium sp.]|nr:hypothetical protein [Ignavibacterium sp.]
MNRKHMSFKLMLLVVYVLINFVSCFELPDELIAPQWQVDLNVPLLNKVYTLNDILKDDPHITIDTSGGNSIYILQSETYKLSSGLAEFIQITTETTSQNNLIPASDSVIVYIEFPEGAALDSAVFDEGYLSISVYNPSLHHADLMLRIPGIINPAGDELVLNFGVESFKTDSIRYNLQNHTYRFPASQPLDKKNNLQIIGKTYSQVPEETVLSASYFISDFYFKSVSGLLPSKALSEREESFGFEMDETEEYRERATLREARLTLEATYYSPAADPVGVEIRNLNIIGMHKNGGEIYLRDASGNINHTLKFNGTFIEKIYDEQNSNINDFITFLPDTIVLRAEYFMNPDHLVGTATNEDSIKFETDFLTKSFLSLKSTNIQDITAIDMGKDDRELIKDGSAADFVLELENAIPLGVWFKMDMMDEQNNFLFTLTKNNNGTDSIYFEPAEVDENGEVLTSTVNQPIRIILDSAQVEMLSRTHSANYSVTISTKNANDPDPPTVSIRPSAWLKVKAFSTIKYKVND